MQIEIHRLDDRYLDWAADLLRHEWGSTQVVSRGRLHDALQLPGFVALCDGRPLGLTTYRLAADECELTTINSIRSGEGIGTALLDAVKEEAQRAGCRRLWLITTNDNLEALRFYQLQGFSLAALHRNALAVSRRLKPEIPLVGADGIPLQDEIELELIVKDDRCPTIR